MKTSVATHNTDQSVFAQIQNLGHEQIIFCNDAQTGLRAIIAIHDTTLGPAAGGTRMWSYATEAEALHDVLRLSRGMTLKNALAGLNLGGGKAIIIGDARQDKSEALFRRFGKFVESVGGKYITAEDVGISPRDIEYIAMHTQHVAGKPEYMGGSGDPSPVTAYGVYMGMKAAAKQVYGSESLAGKRIGVQGVGHVGQYLVEHLTKEGAKVIISDFYEDRALEVARKYRVEVVGKDEIYDAPMDIYAPCALGATVNDDTLSRLRCAIIAGAANNQLADEQTHGTRCREMGILYAPDFLINAGGIINVYYEIINQYNRERALRHAENIYEVASEVFRTAHAEQASTHAIALKLALRRIEQIGQLAVKG